MAMPTGTSSLRVATPARSGPGWGGGGLGGGHAVQNKSEVIAKERIDGMS